MYLRILLSVFFWEGAGRYGVSFTVQQQAKLHLKHSNGIGLGAIVHPRAQTAVQQHLACEAGTTFRSLARLLLLGDAVVVNRVFWQWPCAWPGMLIDAWGLASSL